MEIVGRFYQLLTAVGNVKFMLGVSCVVVTVIVDTILIISDSWHNARVSTASDR